MNVAYFPCLAINRLQPHSHLISEIGLEMLNVIDSCLCYSLGFIDYIVLPTLTVLGDTVDLILSTFDIPHSTMVKNKTSLPEEGMENHQQKSSKVLFRPWTDILVENRSAWQRKHDAGKSNKKWLRKLELTLRAGESWEKLTLFSRPHCVL